MSRRPYLLHGLKPGQITPLIEDLYILEKGARFYYAVDPHEIVDFCLPINPESFSPRDIEIVADNQATLYNIFYVSKEKPLLLADYRRELQGIDDHFTYKLDAFYDEAEVLDRFIKDGDLGSMEGRSKEVEHIEEKFNILLAVAMGLYKLGSERFQEVKNKYLAYDVPKTADAELQEKLEEIFDDYEEVPYDEVKSKKESNNLANAIYHRVRSTRQDSEREENIVFDACAVHRLIYLNCALERAYQREELDQRHVILYLSSAQRTDTIFSMPEVNKALPIIAGKPYRFWRTRDQIFAYLVHRSKKEHPGQHVGESIENLKRVQRVLKEIQETERMGSWETSKCQSCILDGYASNDCRRLELCRDIDRLRREIQEHKADIENLGLFTTVVQKVDEYQRLVQARPSGPKGVYVELFKEACNSGIKDVALERMKQKLQWVQGASETINIVKESLQMQDRRSLRSKRDRITGIDQILPTKPKLKSKRYTQILEAIIKYYKDPKDPILMQDLTQAYERYWKLNPSLETEDPEHRLVRCYLFLAFARDEDDEEKAYSYSKGLLNAARDLNTWPSLRQEARYVLCWAARRLGRFEEADRCGKVALRNSPYDPRFYHGLSLNAYSWLTQDPPDPNCPYDVVSAIQFARAAVENYKREDEDANRDVIAANYNNLAYFLAWDTTENQYTLDVGRERLVRARDYLVKLKGLVPKEDWVPSHPEYFHTEAYLEFQEYKLDWFDKKDKTYLEAKLKNALREIKIAKQLYEENSGYDLLRESIEKALSDISSGRLSI